MYRIVAPTWMHDRLVRVPLEQGQYRSLALFKRLSGPRLLMPTDVPASPVPCVSRESSFKPPDG